MKIYLSLFTILLISFSAFCQSDESSNLNYGMKLYNDKIYDVAITQFKNFMEQYGSSVSAPKVQYFLAESYIASGDKENALKSYQKLILDYPKSEYAEASILKTADIYKELGDKEKSARYYLQLKNYFPSSSQIPESYFKAIGLFREINMIEQAKDNIALLQKSYPSNNFTKLSMLILAEIYENENQSKLSDRTYYEILRSTTGGIKTHAALLYSKFLHRINDLSNARRILKEAFKEISKQDENYYPVLIDLTGLLLYSNSYDEASRLIEAEKNIPDNYKADITEIKGDLEYFKGNFSKAVSYYDEVLSIKSGFFDTEIKKAYALNSLKEYEKAGECFLSAAMSDKQAEIEKEPVKSAFLSAVDNFFSGKNYEKGVFVLKKYLEQFPNEVNSSKINFMIGRSYYDAGKYSSAFEILKNHPLEYPASEFNDDAVFISAESAYKASDWKGAYGQYDILIKNYGASEYKILSESRIKYLTEHNLRESDLSDKLADLSSRSLFEDNKTKLLLDWGKLYFYDLKDYAKATDFINRYFLSVKKEDMGFEAKFIKAVSLSRLKNSEKPALKESYDILKAILSDTGAQKNLRFKAAAEMIYIADKALENTELGINLDSIYEIVTRDQLDDLDGTLAYKYFSNKVKLSRPMPLAQIITAGFKTRTNSVYFDDAEFLKANIFKENGDIKSSKEILKNLARSDKNSSAVFQSLNLLADQPDESADDRIKYLSKIEKTFFYAVSNSEITERKAKIYFENNRHEQALSLYLSLDKEMTKGAISSLWNFSGKDYALNIADIYFKTGELSKAETYYQRALSNKNAALDRQYILLKLSEIYRSQNNSGALEENYKLLSSISGGNNSYQAALSLADIELEKDNFTKAISQYEDILKKFNPDDRRVVESRIIKAQFAKKSVTEGDKLINEFRKKYKDDYDKNIYEPEFYLAKSNSYLSLNEYDKAVKGYSALQKEYPKSVLVPKAMYGEAVCLYNIGKKDEAFEIWKSVVDKYPEDEIAVETNYHLGAIYNNREEFDKAISSFQQILKYPKDHRLKKNTYKNIIDLYLKLGFNDAGGKMIREYISAYPDEDDVFQKRIEIGNIYQRNEEYDTALDYFKRLLYEAKGDDEAACQFFIAETYMMMKNYRQAITEFLKVKYILKIDSPLEWKLTSVYKTALCYEELAEYDKALELLEPIAKEHAGDSYGKQAKKVVERIEGKKSITK